MGSDRPQGSRRPSSRTGPSTQVSWLLVLVSFPKHLSKELLDTTSSLHPWGTHGRHRYSIIWDEEILRKTGSLLEPGPEATSDTGTLGWCAGTQSVGLTHVWLWHSGAVCGRAECGPYPRLTLALWGGVWACRVWALPTSDTLALWGGVWACRVWALPTSDTLALWGGVWARRVWALPA